LYAHGAATGGPADDAMTGVDAVAGAVAHFHWATSTRRPRP
jgi:hypothetical protein